MSPCHSTMRLIYAMDPMQLVAVKPPDLTGTGCSTVSDQVAMETVTKVANSVREVQSMADSGELDHSYATFTNHAAFAVSCAVHFHRNGKMDTKNLVMFDLSAGQTSVEKQPEPADSGMGGGLPPAAAGTMQFKCYAKGSVDTSGKACTTHIW